MRTAVGIWLILLLSACGTATVDDTTGAAGTTAASTAAASAADSSPQAAASTAGSGTAGITVSEAWVRAAVLMGDAAASEMPMAASAAPEISMAASPMGSGMETDGMEMGAVSAGYMTLSNNGAEADRLIGASSDVAGEVQMHTSEMNNNVMSMHQVEAIDVPANGSVTLEPGSYHLMFLDLKRGLAAGETVKVTLRFERAGTIEVDAPVREAGSE